MKKQVTYSLVALIALLLLGLLAWWDGRLVNEGSGIIGGVITVDANYYLRHNLVTSGLLMVLGIVVEWKRSLSIFRGQVNVDLFLLLGAISLAIIGAIPAIHWKIWFGVTNIPILQMLQSIPVNYLLSFLAGIILIKALTSTLPQK